MGTNSTLFIPVTLLQKLKEYTQFKKYLSNDFSCRSAVNSHSKVSSSFGSVRASSFNRESMVASGQVTAPVLCSATLLSFLLPSRARSLPV